MQRNAIGSDPPMERESNPTERENVLRHGMLIAHRWSYPRIAETPLELALDARPELMCDGNGRER